LASRIKTAAVLAMPCPVLPDVGTAIAGRAQTSSTSMRGPKGAPHVTISPTSHKITNPSPQTRLIRT
jgi:hypothetical protein